MSKEKESSVNELMLETAYTLELLNKKEQTDLKVTQALEEWGVIEKKTKRSKKFNVTKKGVKQILNISLALEGEEDGTKPEIDH